jgi:RNA polymerase sigma-70 factor (ECF subfamily)
MPDRNAESEVWLARAAAGELSARTRLLQLHRDRLRRMVAVRLDRRLLQRIDPSDIIQETLMVADRRLDEYLRDQPIPFYPWLRQLAWDQMVTALRRHLSAGRRSRTREEVIVPALSDESVAELASCLVDHSADPFRKLLRAEAHGRLHQALAQLADEDREILVLRHLEQLSTSEAAAVLNIGESAAKMRHLRALQRLRDQLGNEPLESSP